MMHLTAHTARTLSCVSASGAIRSIANKIAIAHCVPVDSLRMRADKEPAAAEAGRVYSSGVWRDAAARAQLANALGSRLAYGLRDDFEWYRCRGAFFHNDAHYDNRLFGVWCISASPADLVFPRAPMRLTISTGSIVVFDPFEVHGIVRPNAEKFSASDYDKAEAVVLLGFELDLTADIAVAFGITPGIAGPLVSSRSRINATTGAIAFID